MRAATTLTGFHFTVTALVGWISNATGYSVSKHVPLWELVWFSLVANTSITGMNLSLMLNSVGFYQVYRVLRHWRHLRRPLARVARVAQDEKFCADLQTEHDSGGLPHGMGAEQQALYHQGYFRGGRRGSRRWDLHGHGCRGQCQGIPLRVCGCVLHVAATNCELLSLFVTIFHAKLLHCVFLVFLD
jgi:hypothetical protein